MLKWRFYMGFAEKLKSIRKEKNLSQEQLAELLDVSRQAVSKWEQDHGYPETEKLISLATQLNISLDYLMLSNQEEPVKAETKEISIKETTYLSDKRIIVKSFDGTMACSCYKFYISPILLPTYNEPKAILNGVDMRTFWGEHSNSLGYYEHVDDAKKELQGIIDAINNCEIMYELQYYANVKIGIVGVKLTKQS